MYRSNVAAGLHSIVLYGTEPPMEAPSSSLGATDLTLCIGLVVAFIIFLAVVLIIVKILRKKNIPHSGYTLTAAGGGNASVSYLLSDLYLVVTHLYCPPHVFM